MFRIKLKIMVVFIIIADFEITIRIEYLTKIFFLKEYIKLVVLILGRKWLNIY